MNQGYIYIRTNEYWNIYNACKLGKTTNIPDREHTYVTSEIKRGEYIMVIELNLLILDNIEIQLQQHFNELNLQIKYDGGIEFYNKDIISLIIPYLDTLNIKYRILSPNDINLLIGLPYFE